MKAKRNLTSKIIIVMLHISLLVNQNEKMINMRSLGEYLLLKTVIYNPNPQSRKIKYTSL